MEMITTMKLFKYLKMVPHVKENQLKEVFQADFKYFNCAEKYQTGFDDHCYIQCL